MSGATRLATGAAITLKAGLLVCLIAWAAADMPPLGLPSLAAPPPVTVPDPRTLSGVIGVEVTHRSFRDPRPGPVAFVLVEELGVGGIPASRTWRLVTTDLSQSRWLSEHIAYSVMLLGRRGERAGDWYFLVDSFRESEPEPK